MGSVKAPGLYSSCLQMLIILLLTPERIEGLTLGFGFPLLCH